MQSSFRVTGMHCSSCAMVIDGEVEDLPGVTRSTTDLRKARTTVEYDPALTTPDQIAATIASAGDYASTEE